MGSPLFRLERISGSHCDTKGMHCYAYSQIRQLIINQMSQKMHFACAAKTIITKRTHCRPPYFINYNKNYLGSLNMHQRAIKTVFHNNLTTQNYNIQYIYSYSWATRSFRPHTIPKQLKTFRIHKQQKSLSLCGLTKRQSISRLSALILAGLLFRLILAELS